MDMNGSLSIDVNLKEKKRGLLRKEEVLGLLPIVAIT